MSAFTEQQFIEAFDQVIDERGEDFTYSEVGDIGDCRYADVGGAEPLCVFGAVFAKLGPDLLQFAHVREGESIQGVLSEMSEVGLCAPFRSVVVSAAVEAQGVQDSDNTYYWVKERFHEVLGGH